MNNLQTTDTWRYLAIAIATCTLFILLPWLRPETPNTPQKPQPKVTEKITPEAPPAKKPQATISVSQKKQQFFDLMAPGIESGNEKILKDRYFLQQIQLKNSALTLEEQTRYDTIKKQYKVTTDNWQELLDRVDVIPPALALAQSANESAWGKSRFAREGNNFFGQWCFKVGCGIIPAQRPEGKTYEVQRFASVQDAINTYLYNLNTQAAYHDLRQIRSTLREQQQPLTGVTLAMGLEKYSARGQHYIDEIQAMIKHNHLDQRYPSPVPLALTQAQPQAQVSE